eukprot:3094257-Pyramimonas_sp.AAC.1
MFVGQFLSPPPSPNVAFGSKDQPVLPPTMLLHVLLSYVLVWLVSLQGDWQRLRVDDARETRNASSAVRCIRDAPCFLK